MSQRIEIPLVGGHYKSRTLKVDAQECINLYPIIDKSGGRFASLLPVPGLKEWVDTTVEDKAVRAEFKFSDTVLYVLIGNTVYNIDQAGTYTAIATTLDNDAGPVQIETNGTQIMILDLTDGKAYVIESDVLTKITDVDFPPGSSLTYQDGYAIVGKKDTKRFYISTLDAASLAAYEASDFTRWEALDFERAEGLSGNLKAIISDHDELWAMGSDQVGFYYNSANPDFPFTKTQHPFQEVGLGGSPACIVKLDNSLFWIDSWNNVRKADGYTPVIISTPEISSLIEEFSTISDAFAFGHRYAGQAFYCITFPTANKTYCYDVSTGVWHLRSTGLNGGRWRANCYVKFARKHLFGDYQHGKIYELDPDVFTDAGETYQATRVTRYTDAQRRRVFYHRLELHMKSGVGNIVSPGDDPQIMLQWSDDGGQNWSGEKWASLGKIGKTTHRVIWRKLGRSRERIFRFRITDPVNRVMIALYADITIGTE
jgi:hypothetical protein